MKKLITALVALSAGTVAMAADGAAAAPVAQAASNGLAIFGVMFGMSIATLGGALGQGKAAAAALEGVARNPGAASKVQLPMILGLALIESLVILTFLMGLNLLGKF